jgi:hypothetical protein
MSNFALKMDNLFSGMPFMKASDNLYQMVRDLHFMAELKQSMQIYLISVPGNYILNREKKHKILTTFEFTTIIQSNMPRTITSTKNINGKHFCLSLKVEKFKDKYYVTLPSLEIIN